MTASKDIDAIVQSIDSLTAICQKLQDENRQLRLSQEVLHKERAGLTAKNDQARARVEAMIDRLKALENNA